MFTGIIKAVGIIESYDPVTSLIKVESPYFETELFETSMSIAVDGICLTVSHRHDDNPRLLGFDLGNETKKVSLLTKKSPKTAVNIEPALKLGDALGGHLVQGHVDGIGILASIEDVVDGKLFTFSYPVDLGPLIVDKGSITIDGVSLTVNKVNGHLFSVCLVPYTLRHTTLREKNIGDPIHLETDIIGRYLNRFFELQATTINFKSPKEHAYDNATNGTFA